MITLSISARQTISACAHYAEINGMRSLCRINAGICESTHLRRQKQGVRSLNRINTGVKERTAPLYIYPPRALIALGGFLTPPPGSKE
jgi:hypothetical protein